ncbi:MAG: hypothetical protein PSX80_09640 [bacterium]|nr:hypothetical protein [bacterium]
MKTNDELFEFLRSLVAELENMSEKDRADRIRAAAAISSVGTEILMLVRAELLALDQSEVAIKPDTSKHVREAIQGIDRELSR